jgi:riboflavin kinase / FMN adenylyltransferase
MLSAGDVAGAARDLGRPHRVEGVVVRGAQRGRELGFPTANLVPDERIVCPSHGVYACLADGRAAAVSIGVRPTFETGRAELIEAFILDFAQDLYGQRLKLEFLERLRGERRFASAEALVEQMHLDVEETREIAG